jgi:hypothetical protein
MTKTQRKIYEKIYDKEFPRFPKGRRKINSKLDKRIHQFLVKDVDPMLNVYISIYYTCTDIFGGDWE